MHRRASLWRPAPSQSLLLLSLPVFDATPMLPVSVPHAAAVPRPSPPACSSRLVRQHNHAPGETAVE